jgi:phosphoglucomutase
MTDNSILKTAKERLSDKYDAETREKVQDLIDNNPQELTDAFYKNLSFGTGGMRGIMGVGTNRINKYTLGSATQGFSNYLKKAFSDKASIKVAIAYDNRNNSPEFAKLCADVFSANGFKVYLFEELRPTPVLSFAVRHWNCQAGVMLTASHNPKEYNGYKAYWSDGAQVVPPHDKGIIEAVNAITDVSQIRFDGKPEHIKIIGDETDTVYLKKVKSLSLSPELINTDKNFKIVFSPLHGTAVKLVPAALKQFGFTHIYNVSEQDDTSGEFPTVVSPNPENAEALSMVLKKAEETDADMAAATDPDGDRVGIAVRNTENKFVLLNGNQTASVLIYYLLSMYKKKNLLKGQEYIVKTIVTTELLSDMAKSFDVTCYDTLTGFKYIAELLKKYERRKTFIGGGEESYGYLAGDFVRDKDAVISTALIAEAAVWARSQGKTFYELLIDIYIKFGFYKEALVNMAKAGKAGEEAIKTMMDNFRNNPPAQIAGSDIIKINDFEESICTVLKKGEKSPIELPKSNVIQFFTEAGEKITVRPSGTEPKIKFYIAVKTDLKKKEDYKATEQKLETRIREIKQDLGV